MDKKNNFSTRQQSHPHREGQMDNVTPQQSGTGQRVSENKSQAMGDMLNDSEEQKAGRTDNGRSEEDVQQDERQP
jgi:hypothetical protein